MSGETTLDEREEMVLVKIWGLSEKNKSAEETTISAEIEPLILQCLLKKDYLVSHKEGWHFTKRGEEYTRDLIRRRRLTELLLSNILKLELNAVERNACKIEHIINGEVTDSICAFLGHPTHCPHGRAIPSGPCCSKQEGMVKPLIKTLSNFMVGEKGRVVIIASNDNNQVHRLTGLGLYPGALITLRQQKPTSIIRTGETDIALETDIAKKIYCRPL